MTTLSKNATRPIEINSTKYFAYCGIGGILACGTTHFGMTPIDMLKCRMQVDPKAYHGIFSGIRKVASTKGLSGLYLGGTATFIGYSLQGMGKYGFYEYFKYAYGQVVGQDRAQRHKTLLYLSASASAEFLADIMLCPLETIKVRMQTAAPGTSVGGFASTLGGIRVAEGLRGFYKGIGPLWLRQIPYTMVKFASFENIVEAIYSRVLQRPKSQLSKPQQLGVTFAAGYLAGIMCAVVSHPADTVVSKLNSRGEGQTTVSSILKDLGFRGLWAGLLPRIFMIGTLTATQWLIFDAFKVRTGLPTTGGDGSHKR
ncbi:Cu/Pi carrier [Coemansia interrupta]|uniref:Cu/Pi carrier n=1 Tax=Coemansia interrupta TaxID=1126814 RepID=A0A9W8LMS2_9FUNG|nr:Cu/Pi carrier [Coemansia interrupta]